MFLNSYKDTRKGLIWRTGKSSLLDQSVKYLIDQLKVQSELLAMGKNIMESWARATERRMYRDLVWYDYALRFCTYLLDNIATSFYSYYAGTFKY